MIEWDVISKKYKIFIEDQQTNSTMLKFLLIPIHFNIKGVNEVSIFVNHDK